MDEMVSYKVRTSFRGGIARMGNQIYLKNAIF